MIRSVPHPRTDKPAAWWWTTPHHPDERLRLPPDLMTHHRLPTCDATDRRHPFRCTRPPGHTARHAASAGTYIVAVWP